MGLKLKGKIGRALLSAFAGIFFWQAGASIKNPGSSESLNKASAAEIKSNYQKVKELSLELSDKDVTESYDKTAEAGVELIAGEIEGINASARRKLYTSMDETTKLDMFIDLSHRYFTLDSDDGS